MEKQQTQPSFPKGCLFQLICKNGENALKIQNTQLHLGSKVMTTPVNNQDISQLWYIDKVNHGKDFEIVNAVSGLVFDDNAGIINLTKGVWGKHQMFQIEKAPNGKYYQYYWIKLSKNTKKAICFEGTLRCSDFDQNDEKQMFRFEAVDNNMLFNRTVCILNAKSESKAIDVPGSSHKECQEIIQFQFNNRFNQRWLLIKTGVLGHYQIQSFKTGMNLDICGESKVPGAKIIQYKRTAAPNQLWTIQQNQDETYCIRSVLCDKLYICVQKNSTSDEAKLVTGTIPTLWKIKGSQF